MQRILARTPKQVEYVRVLRNKNVPIVIAHGPAGCGKTMLAANVGIEEFEKGNVQRLVFSRPAVCSDEQHGFLPGTLEDKMSPWVRPIVDCMRDRWSDKEVKRLCQDGRIEFAPLAFMRGRTFRESWVVCDEAQNCTQNQVLMVLTRIGEGSKIVLTGDLEQHDHKIESGLLDFVDRLERNPQDALFGLVAFDSSDVQRHPVIPKVLDLYRS
jgi:phosphate starvation-inducible protein PhoH and related proteins